MEYCYIHPKDDELMHYGVKGMHWGIRRYQPYTSSNKRKGGKTGKFVGKASNKNKTSTNKKEAIPIGLAVWGGAYLAMIGAAMAKVGAQKISKVHNTNLAKKAIKHIDNNKNLDPKTGMKKIDKPESIKDSMKHINTEKKGNERAEEINRQKNCTSCAMALTLRQKGYDVRASELAEGRSDEKTYLNKIFGVKPTQVDKKYDLSNAEYKKKGKTYLNEEKLTNEQKMSRNSASEGLNVKHANDVNNWAKTQPDQTGQLMLSWGNGGGHATNYEIKSGKLFVHDPQVNKSFSGSNMNKNFFYTSWTSDFYRLDDKEIKNAKMAREMVYH